MIVGINAEKLREIFAGGAKNLNLNRDFVDSLNVFPVPDGDTGTNMYFTMKSIVNKANEVTKPTMGKICSALQDGALNGARGNSGVILSQIVKGMSQVFSEANEITTRTFTRALKNGSKVAYEVMEKPQEGTILTVIRLVSNYASKISSRKNDFVEYFEKILEKGEAVLADTPNMLPVLKKAGVVDAGGRGLLTILYGMYYTLAGIPMEDVEEDFSQDIDNDAIIEIENIEDIKYAYCTEFFVINLIKKATLADIDKLKESLSHIGDCVLVVGDLKKVKVHVHTNRPDQALAQALKLGELFEPKIENMVEQHRQITEKRKATEKQEEPEVREEKETGLVAICNGEGIREIFKQLGADQIIEGGQTMNPSVEDIASAVDKLNAKTVYILPNNSNIVLAAEQAKSVVKTNLIVIPSKNIPQGVAAALNIDLTAEIEANIEMTRRAMAAVHSGQVTKSVRKTEMDGFNLEIGDYIGLYKKLVSKGTDLKEVTLALVDSMVDSDSSTIALYSGADMKQDEVEDIVNALQEKYKFFDIMSYEGGQQHYNFYISVE